MALREDLLPVIEDSRQLIQDLGLRTSRVWVRAGTWDGGELLLGDLDNEDTEITPRPKVIQRGNKLEVTGITPSDGTIGWEPQDLVPDAAYNVDHYAVVMGPDGNAKPYAIESINTRKNFRYELVLTPIDLVEPDLADYS